MNENYSNQVDEVEKTTDNFFEFPFYSKKGKLHRQKVSQIALLLYLTTIFTLYNIGSFIYYLTIEKINILNYYTLFLEQTLFYISDRFTDIQTYGINILSINEISIIISLTLLPIVPVIFFLRWVFKKARIQANLASVGLEHYYLKKVYKKKNTYIFKLLTGYRMSYETFVSEFDNLKQLFGEGDIEYCRYKSDMVKVQFKNALIDIDDVKASSTKKLTLSKLLKPNKLLLGATSINGNVVYATDKEEGNGLLNGHFLVVGASGSGKSISVKSFCMNFLLPQNYKYIDDIFVINYKQSSDYNFLKTLNKVHYAQDIKESLKLLKLIQLNMFNKYLYNSKYNQDNFTATQTIVIIDEIQTLPEMLDSKGLHKIERNSIQESLSIIEMLGSKARASNISLMVILQKGDIASLPSTAFRQNLRNRFMLKQENNISASLVINSEILEKENIKPLELKQGQFIYLDTLKNELQRGLTIFPDTEIDIDMLNSLEFDKDIQTVIDEVAKNKSASLNAIKEQKEELEKLASSGKKTFYDGFDDVENDTLIVETNKVDILDDIDSLLNNKSI
jgi:ABC-type dipeptide/oligopeptide/nickel transport system ATPase component